MPRAVALFCLLLCLCRPALAGEEGLQFLRIATGSAASTAFPVGMAIASAISSPPGSRPCDKGGSCGVPGLVAVAQTSDGSVANVAAVAGGLMDSALAQSDIVYGAVNGEGLYFRRAKLPNLRVIANLYPDSVHLVVRKGSGIAKVTDLVGKRVSLDRPGSGTRLNAELILTSFGVRLNQLEVVEIDPGQAFDLFQQNELDAFFVIGGYPIAAVADLAALGLADLVPLAGRPAEQALRRHRFYSHDTIPAGTYKGIGATQTLSLGAQWVIDERVDEELVYQITRALWHKRNRLTLDSGHEKARLIQLGTALEGVSTPLHAGAARYYREVGVLTGEEPGSLPSQ
jgi:TRAP transporter TAXI family solute receptor